MGGFGGSFDGSGLGGATTPKGRGATKGNEGEFRGKLKPFFKFARPWNRARFFLRGITAPPKRPGLEPPDFFLGENFFL